METKRRVFVKAEQAQSAALHATLKMLASDMAESAPGSELVVNRLADALFIQFYPRRCQVAVGYL